MSPLAPIKGVFAARGARGPRTGKRHLRIAVAALACALAAVGLYVWQTHAAIDAGTTVSESKGRTRKEIQDELDRVVRDNMIAISVAPVAQIGDDGMLRVNVENTDGNKFPQRFRVIQNDATVYESGVVEPGRAVEYCPAGSIEEGDAFIEIQALDAKTLDAHGNPTRVKVKVSRAEA